MAKFVLVVTIEVPPESRDKFLSMMMAHRARCLKDEPGTVQFDVMVPADDSGKVLLYEVYRDEAPFDAHSKGPSLAQRRAEAGSLMKKVTATRCTLVE